MIGRGNEQRVIPAAVPLQRGNDPAEQVVGEADLEQMGLMGPVRDVAVTLPVGFPDEAAEVLGAVGILQPRG